MCLILGDGVPVQLKFWEYYFMRSDIDPVETQEWLDALDSMLEAEGKNRAEYILDRLSSHACLRSISQPSITTPYRNTIASSDEKKIEGDQEMERRIRALIRWNAAVLVVRANRQDGSLGGHIASFSSSATLYDVGFNHFFRGANEHQEGDLVYFQGHIAPGIYARAFLEGRITEEQLNNFRSEVGGKGLPSYPHPWLMPDFWQFPTVSMGLGALQAIYQGRYMKYMINRGIMPDHGRKIWAFLGDGEMDEPESLGSITLAGREKLDNLIFVVNCNLQRLDGPVRGNGKIIQELEGIFRGAGWNVVKCIWGSEWDNLLAKDYSGALQQVMNDACDGLYQNCKFRGGAWTRENFFGLNPEAAKLVDNLSDDEIFRLKRGGHDPQKVFAAYHHAVNHKGQPTVILVKTVKGYGTGPSAESVNVSHQVKKLSNDDMKHLRDRFDIPVTDKELDSLPYVSLKPDSKEFKYIKERRECLGGAIPARRKKTSVKLKAPKLSDFNAVLKGTGKREISTTMAFTRILGVLLKNEQLSKYVVPIIPDEARTFGMEGLFRQIGIYAHEGQSYEPQDSAQIMFYKEAKTGQILQEGINEGGAQAIWMAAATSYSTNNVPMIPFYIYYSMFGFQRVGDLAWASGDMQARGFLIGATAGRTTLNGEGLQHQDGHSHILASTIPNCVAYDSAFGYELAVIIRDGMRRMIEKQENVFYYLTTMNENYQHPALPEDSAIEEGIIKGLYCLKKCTNSKKLRAQLLGSGTILMEVIAAAKILQEEFGIDADIWSATSFNELRREALDIERWNMLNANKKTKVSWVKKHLAKSKGPVVAATDYIKLYSDQIRAFIPEKTFVALGTDGFGRSDSRANLRAHFEVDRYFVVIATLQALAKEGQLEVKTLTDAIKKFGISPDKINPMYC